MSKRKYKMKDEDKPKARKALPGIFTSPVTGATISTGGQDDSNSVSRKKSLGRGAQKMNKKKKVDSVGSTIHTGSKMGRKK
jgi:hypothetical protein